MNPSVLSGRGLVKAFRQGRVLAPVLHGLSLDIAALNRKNARSA